MGTVAIGIGIGIGIGLGSVETVLHIFIEANFIGIGIGVGQWKHTIRMYINKRDTYRFSFMKLTIFSSDSLASVLFMTFNPKEFKPWNPALLW